MGDERSEFRDQEVRGLRVDMAEKRHEESLKERWD